MRHFFFSFLNLFDINLISLCNEAAERDLGQHQLHSRASSVCFRCSHVGASSVVTLSSGEMNHWLQPCCENKGPFFQKSASPRPN